ncbi:hypothetical protein IHE44_0012820, partial [Lamprotornis superbus]
MHIPFPDPTRPFTPSQTSLHPSSYGRYPNKRGKHPSKVLELRKRKHGWCPAAGGLDTKLMQELIAGLFMCLDQREMFALQMSGLPEEEIQKGKDLKSISEIVQDGKKFKVTVTTGSKVMKNEFIIGEESEIELLNGEKVKTVVQMEGNNKLVTQVKGMKSVTELNGDTITHLGSRDKTGDDTYLQVFGNWVGRSMGYQENGIGFTDQAMASFNEASVPVSHSRPHHGHPQLSVVG